LCDSAQAGRGPAPGSRSARSSLNRLDRYRRTHKAIPQLRTTTDECRAHRRFFLRSTADWSLSSRTVRCRIVVFHETDAPILGVRSLVVVGTIEQQVFRIPPRSVA